MVATAYADRGGQIHFTTARSVPKGMIAFARHRELDQLEQIVSAKCRHGYDGTTLLVPGVPEARSDEDALEALERWRDWSFQHYRFVHGVALVTDDAHEVV